MCDLSEYKKQQKEVCIVALLHCTNSNYANFTSRPQKYYLIL